MEGVSIVCAAQQYVKLVDGKTLAITSHGELKSKREIERLCTVPTSSAWNASAVAGEPLMAAALRDGAVEVWSAQQSGADARVCARFQSAPGPVVGFGTVGSAGSLLTCAQSGEVRVWAPPAARGAAPTLSASFTVPGPLAAMRIEPTARADVACGGKTRDLTVWSIEQEKAIFAAENQPDDWLDMPVPNWITDLCFVSPLASSSSSGASAGAVAAAAPAASSACAHLIVTVTSHRQIRLYDCRAQRKPVKFYDDIAGGDGQNAYALRLVAPAPDGASVFVSDTTGGLYRRSLSTGKLMASYKGVQGSLRSLDIAPDATTVACVGLDRFLHIYDIKSRRRLKKVYMKQKMNAVLHCTFGEAHRAEEAAEAAAEASAAAAEHAAAVERGDIVEEEDASADVWGMLEGGGEIDDASGPPEKKRRM